MHTRLDRWDEASSKIQSDIMLQAGSYVGNSVHAYISSKPVRMSEEAPDATGLI